MDDNRTFIASNYTSWHWEYDQTHTTAKLYAKPTGELELELQKTSVKTGLGAGTYPSAPEFYPVGTLNKPKLAVIRAILAKHNNRGHWSNYPFSKNWTALNGKSTSLKDLIADVAKRFDPKKAKLSHYVK